MVTVWIIYYASGYGKISAHIIALIQFSALIPRIIFSDGYRVNRFIAFLDPFKYQQTSGYQLAQAISSIGRGGLTGAGFNNGFAKEYYLPEIQTDFPIVNIAEEFGFIGVIIILGLYYILLIRSFIISIKSVSPFDKTIGLTFTLWLYLSITTNMMVSIGLLPTKGCVLPFISYGANFNHTFYFSLGIILNISSRSTTIHTAITPKPYNRKNRLKLYLYNSLNKVKSFKNGFFMGLVEIIIKISTLVGICIGVAVWVLKHLN